MTDLLAPQRHESVLEVGTGLGYQTAVLAELAGHVWSVEIVEELGNHAQMRLQQLGYATVDIRIGDGSRGWVEHAPYDKILVTAAAEQPPAALLEQLKPGGRLVLPLVLLMTSGSRSLTRMQWDRPAPETSSRYASAFLRRSSEQAANLTVPTARPLWRRHRDQHPITITSHLYDSREILVIFSTSECAVWVRL
jgi:protein-L-isoaspartate O-methyltransferase